MLATEASWYSEIQFSRDNKINDDKKKHLS